MITRKQKANMVFVMGTIAFLLVLLTFFLYLEVGLVYCTIFILACIGGMVFLWAVDHI